MQTRITRCVFKHVVHALLLSVLAGCAGLQEPEQRIAEAATSASAQLIGAARAAAGKIVAVHKEPVTPLEPAPTTVAFTVPLSVVPTLSAPSVTPVHFHLNAATDRPEVRTPAIVAAYRYRADTAEAAGDYHRAIDAQRRWLGLAPMNSAGWARLARLQERIRDDKAMESSLDRALRYNPTNDAARLDRARLMLRHQRYRPAIGEFDAYLSRHPGSANILRMKIVAARDAGDHATALGAIDQYVALAPDDVAILEVRGGELEARGDDRAAISAWKDYLQRRPQDADVYRQVAYASERTGDAPGAVWALSEYVRLRPTDERLKLALAYDQTRAGHPELAAAEFAQLEHSPDADVAARATAELKARMKGIPGSSQFAYSTVQYDSRFGDIVFGMDTYALARGGRFQSYAVLHSWDDTRSSGRGYEPVVYNDNAIVFGGGLRYNVGSRPGRYFFAEAGEQLSLIGRGNSPELRYGFASWSESGRPGGAHTSYGFSVASYSRYGANVIGYGNILHDFPLLASLRGVAGFNFALDTHREYWNNVGEFELGIKVGSPRLAVTLAGVGGMYLPRGGEAPAKRFYTTLRPALTWSPRL